MVAAPGVFMDTASWELILRPPNSDEDIEKRFALAVSHAHSKGVTSLHDAGAFPVTMKFILRFVVLSMASSDIPLTFTYQESRTRRDIARKHQISSRLILKFTHILRFGSTEWRIMMRRGSIGEIRGLL
jgi:hypothetical protein